METGQVGIQDNFFELGGHSLLATKMVARIRESLDIDLPLTAAFRSLTVEALAKTVEELLSAKAEAEMADALLDKLDNLSDQEVELLLSKHAVASAADTSA